MSHFGALIQAPLLSLPLNHDRCLALWKAKRFENAPDAVLKYARGKLTLSLYSDFTPVWVRRGMEIYPSSLVYAREVHALAGGGYSLSVQLFLSRVSFLQSRGQSSSATPTAYPDCLRSSVRQLPSP